MEYNVTQDDVGTRLDRHHDEVTAEMIDWFSGNLKQGFILWHPE